MHPEGHRVGSGCLERALAVIGFAEFIGVVSLGRSGHWSALRGCSVPLVSLGSLGYALDFVRCPRVNWGVPFRVIGFVRCATLCSFGVAGFIGVRPGGRRVRSRSLGSLGCALRVIGFVRGCWVRRVCRLVRSVSLGFALGTLVLSGSLRSLGCAQRVIGFAGFIVVPPGVRSMSLRSLGYALVVVGFVRCRSVHWGAPWGSSASFGVAGFSPEGRQVRFGSLGLPWGSSGLFVVAGFFRVRTGGHRVRSVSVGHRGAPWGSYGLFSVARFIGVRPGCRRVRSVLLGSLGFALWDVGLVTGSWVH